MGVDIGTTSIKVCQLKQTRKGYEMSAFGYAALRPQVIVDGQVMDAAAVIEAIQQIWREAKISQRDVAIGVSGQSAIIRKINVPLMTDAELSEQIQWEAEQHIPFDIKDVQVDYQVLRRNPEEGQMEVLLVAAKKEQIEEYARLARDAKLRPVVCDIDAFSIQNLFEVTRGIDPIARIGLINVGASLSSLNVISGGISAFSREIANGGNAVTEEIQRTLNVPFEQAEAYKCGDGRDGMIPSQVLEVIDGSCDAIAAEIQRSLDFFMATSGDSDLTRLYLTGGSAALPPLAQAIESRSRIPVELWTPTQGLAGFKKNIDPGALDRHALQLSVSLGLALRKEREVRA